jgi:quercetin dioxygenase-like cupin family protein
MQNTSWERAPSLEPLPGVKIAIIGNGMLATMCYIVIQPGAVVDWHSHHQEQMGTLICGKGTLTSGGKTVKVEKGSAWLISPNEEHRFETVGDHSAIVIETFAPARVDYVINTK